MDAIDSSRFTGCHAIGECEIIWAKGTWHGTWWACEYVEQQNKHQYN